MALTSIQYLGTVLLKNIEGTYTSDELQAFLDQEGSVKLAQAAAFEVEASRVMFQFSAGDSSVNKAPYATNLLSAASQIRKDAMSYPSDISSVVTWGSADFGTQAVEDWINTDDRTPDW